MNAALRWYGFVPSRAGPWGKADEAIKTYGTNGLSDACRNKVAVLKAFLICYQNHGLNANDFWNIALWVDGFRNAGGGPTPNGGNLTTDGIPTSFYHQSVARAVFGNTIATTNANYQPLVRLPLLRLQSALPQVPSGCELGQAVAQERGRVVC